MKRQVSALGLMGLLVVGGFIGIIAFESEPVQASSGSTLYVGGTGGGNYSTIQAAVNAANPGDTVFVFDDNAPYFEHITINKTINLIGEDRNTTIINGSYSDTIIKITSNWVNITELNITCAGDSWLPYWGIEIVNSNNCRVYNNNFYNNNGSINLRYSSENVIERNVIANDKWYGIYLEFSSNNSIRNNFIKKLGMGIRLYQSNDSMIENNRLDTGGIDICISANNRILMNNISNSYIGIDIYKSLNCTIEMNTIINNIQGIEIFISSKIKIIKNIIFYNTYHNGIYIGKSDYNIILSNDISHNDDGIIFWKSSFNEIIKNNISFNDGDESGNGIYLFDQSSNNIIENNNILNNKDSGIKIEGSLNNKIFHNNIIYNGVQGSDDSNSNFWNNTYPIGGNYWSDYTGKDKYNGPNQDQPGDDGIGDTPYTDISGGSGAQDNYPLMNPVNWTPVNKGSLSGYVRDVFSISIPGARVKIDYHGTFQDDYTDSNGYYYVSSIPICYCTKNVNVTKSGYAPVNIQTGIVENTVYNFTLYQYKNVHNLDTGEYFETIQEAIDDEDTMDGHYLIVSNGTYYENLVINKSIRLYSKPYFQYMLINEITYPFSTDSVIPIIDGNQKDNVISIKATQVTISGFTICNGTNGIHIDWENNIAIRENNILNNDKGIYLIENSDNNIIKFNNLSYNSHGIFVAMDSHNNTMYKNILYNNTRHGIVVKKSNNQTIEHNTISWSEEEGIYFQESSNNNIMNNFISNNLYGFYFHKSSNNTIYHNNFVDNKIQAYEVFSYDNQWNHSYPIGGNYWSDYSGEDYFSGSEQQTFGSDGIGDSPYTSINSSISSVDNYPFMKPTGWLPTDPGILYGYVYDSDWNPLPDAHVKVEFHDTYLEDITDSDGYYRITNIPICNCTKNVSVTRQGFESQWIHLSIGENTFQRFLLNRSMSILNVDTGKYYNSIQGAIDDPTTNNGHTIMVGSGLYFENLWMNKSVTLIWEDKNDTILDGQKELVIYSRTNPVNISGFTITNGADGIYLYETSGNVISNNRIISNRECGLNMYTASNSLFFNNKFSGNGYADIAQFNSTSNSIIDNDFESKGIHINGEYLENYNSHTIINNFVNGKPLYYYKNTHTFFLELIQVGQVILANCSNVMLKNLQINNTYTGVIIGFSSDLTIIYNNISSNMVGLFSYGTSSVFMDGNNISSNEWNGMELESCSNWTITDNDFQENTFHGMFMKSIDNSTIQDNRFLGYSIDAINLAFSYYNIIRNNSILNCSAAIAFSSSYNNVIENNIVSDNDDGILLGYSTSNFIADNLIDTNFMRGIQLAAASDGNLIFNNNISNNGEGIILIASEWNAIFHNNFVNNTAQAYEESLLENLWDDGYPSGGNYWSDYNGTDANNDGIGDTPYVINVNNQDWYPLMEPWPTKTQEALNLNITLELDKHEFYVGEIITGSIEIVNNYPFPVNFNDQEFQRLTGVFFEVISLDTNKEYDATYNYFPIEVMPLSTLTIDFEIDQVFTIINGTKGLNYTDLTIGKYNIYTLFYYGQWFEEEVLYSNTETFEVIQPPGYLNGNGEGESDEFYRSIIFTSITTLIIVIIVIFIGVFGTEVGKYKFFATFVAPLYSRTLKKRKKSYQDGYIRGSVRGYILGNPGETYNTIKRVLELPNGTLAYHLKFLEKEGEVKTERDGIYKRFYPVEGRISEEVLELSKIQKKIVELVKKLPGLTQREISKRLGEPAQKINYHVQMMVDARLLKLKREGNKTKCFVVDEIT